MSTKLRNLIVQYARTQVDLSWSGSMSLSECKETEILAEQARKELQDQLNHVAGRKFRIPKDVSK